MGDARASQNDGGGKERDKNPVDTEYCRVLTCLEDVYAKIESKYRRLIRKGDS